MNDSVYYVGLDVHKKTISYCLKQSDGEVVDAATISAEREDLLKWISTMDRPWIGVMEATLFTGWIYDFLKPYFKELKVANPHMLKAISQAKKKSDRLDAEKLADQLRANLIDECYMMPKHLRDLRSVLRFRNLMVREAVRMRNKIGTLLMEAGISYSKRRLKGRQYFNLLMENIEDVPNSLTDLLKMSRSAMEMFYATEKKITKALREHADIRQRVDYLMTIDGVGEVTALTWILEVGDPKRFSSIKKAISYCGLCSAQKDSGGKSMRGPISKQRNKNLQSKLVEAAKLAPMFNAQLAAVRQKEIGKGNKNRATLAVARKLVAYMLAVDLRQTAFEPESDVLCV